MKAPLHGLPNRILLLFSVFLTIPHIILFLDTAFPDSVCKNYAFLDPAREQNLLYLGSLYSVAISTWALLATHDNFFSHRPSPPKPSGVPVKTRTSPTMTRENSRYICILKMALLSEFTLAMDLSWAWYQGVTYAWNLTLATETGGFDRLMSVTVFAMGVLWFTMMWTLGNFIPFMAFGNLMSVGFEAGVEQVVRWDRSPRRLEDNKKEQ